MAPAGYSAGYSSLTRSEVVLLSTFPSVEILPVSAKGAARVTVTAITTGGPIAAVAFRLDGSELAVDRQAPYVVEITLEAERSLVEAIAIDPSGRPLTKDQRWLERDEPPFAYAGGRRTLSRRTPRGRVVPGRVVEVFELLVDLPSVAQRLCDLLTEQLAIAAPQAMQRDAQGPHAPRELFAQIWVRDSLCGHCQVRLQAVEQHTPPRSAVLLLEPTQCVPLPGSGGG